MKNVYIYCEGPTEESFIDKVLCPYLLNIGVYVRPIVCETKRTSLRKYRGGVSDYHKIKNELLRLCKQHKNEMLTTMFDYYGLPSNTPGIGSTSGDLFERVVRIEKAIEADINMPNLFFNLSVHEFEGLLFSNTSLFYSVADVGAIARLEATRKAFNSPEHINNSADTAPSKILENHIPGYAKVKDGTILSERIGIDAMIEECRHFREWISKIRSLS
jgi:hypothetical protein